MKSISARKSHGHPGYLCGEGGLDDNIKDVSIHTKVERSTDAATLLVDLRNFTPNLNATQEDSNGINVFCHFLSKFYAVCLEGCLLALAPSKRNDPLLYVSSTGDGMLIIFSGKWHFSCAYLASIILSKTLTTCCDEYNKGPHHNGAPAHLSASA